MSMVRGLPAIYEGKKKKKIFVRVLSYVLSFSLVFGDVSFAFAGDLSNNQELSTDAGGLRVDSGNSSNTELDSARNGVPIVQIATPNAQGMSHNKFLDYNVGSRGQILNNSQSNGQSVLGGMINGNNNLENSGSARTILNEVTSSSNSVLNGYIEQFGGSAALFIANPNGISCNGCGFIRTPRVSLITGDSNIEEGRIKEFSLSGSGEVFIGVEGIDLGEEMDYFNIVTRVAKITGSIYGVKSDKSKKDVYVKILTGTDNYDVEKEEVSGGFSSSNGYSDRAWVDNQTSIIGRRSVSVKAEGNTHIKGGEIANKKVDGTDGGNLNISTGSLTYEDIKDSHYSKQQGSGVNIGGTSTISMTNKGSDKEGITRSTIGLGNIKIADQSKSGKIVRNRTGIFEVKTGEEELGQEITGLNREINKSQEIRSDKITGALDFEVSVDNRWFSKKGRDEMKEQLASLPKNMALSVYGAINTASNMVETGVTNLKKNGASIKDTFLAKQNEQKVAIDRLNNKESRDIINNVGNEEQSAKNIEKALQVGVKVGEGSKVYYDEKSKEAGFHDDRNGDTYVNLAKGENSEVTNATNRDSLIGVDAHERGHRVSDNEDFVDMVGREAKTAWKIVNFITGGKGTGDGKVTKESWANANGVGNNDVSNNSLLNKNNNKASSVAPENRNNLTIFVHGTNSSPEQADKDFIKAVGETFNEKVEQLRWSGENIKQARTEEADQLKTMVDSHEFKEGEKLNIVQHSHGGNVVKEWSQEYEGEKKVDNMVFLGTPHRKDYQLNYDVLDENANKINLYDRGDGVQTRGYFDGDIYKGVLRFPKNIRTINNFNNIEIYQTEKVTIYPNISLPQHPSFSHEVDKHIGSIRSHSMLDTKKNWDNHIKPNLK